MAHEISLGVVLTACLEAENLRQLLPSIQQKHSEMSRSYEVKKMDTMTNPDNTLKECDLSGEALSAMVLHIYE